MSFTLIARPLTAVAFAPFGDVIETAGVTPRLINNGFAERFDDLARIDAGQGGGRAGLSLFAAKPRAAPVALDLMERHPLGSQAFVPLSAAPFLIVVAPIGDHVALDALQAFVTDGRQGCNYRAGVWHHPLLALVPQSFLVVDRHGPGANLDERPLPGAVHVVLP